MARKILAIAAVLSLFYPAVCFSTSMSLTPAEGGASLNFGKLDVSSLVSKEVTLRINSTLTGQYQIFQRVSRDFVNETGRNLNLQALEVGALGGSNAAGTSYLDEPIGLSYNDKLIYTSNSNGTSDSLKLVYRLRPEELNTSGSFSGQVMYTLRSAGGEQEIKAYIDVYFDVSGEFKIETESSSGKDSIRLDTEEGKNNHEGYIKFSFSGNF